MSVTASFREPRRYRRKRELQMLSPPAVLLLILVMIGCAMTTKPPDKQMAGNTITRERATQIAQQTVAGLSPDAEFVINSSATVEKEFGWVFFYTPKKYAETGDRKYLVPGAGPLVVLRADGRTMFLTTSVPPQAAIEEFDKEWRKRN